MRLGGEIEIGKVEADRLALLHANVPLAVCSARNEMLRKRGVDDGSRRVGHCDDVGTVWDSAQRGCTVPLRSSFVAAQNARDDWVSSRQEVRNTAGVRDR